MKGAAALRHDQGWRAWIKITINRIKKNKYLAIVEAQWFILHFHGAGWTAAPKKSICNYRHPTLGRSSPIHLPPPALHQHHHPQNKCQNSTGPGTRNKKGSGEHSQVFLCVYWLYMHSFEVMFLLNLIQLYVQFILCVTPCYRKRREINELNKNSYSTFIVWGTVAKWIR